MVNSPDDMIRAAARVMDLNFDPQYKVLIANELFAQLARENRERAEKQGIGTDSELSLKRCYAVEEHLEQLIAGQGPGEIGEEGVEILQTYLNVYHRYLHK